MAGDCFETESGDLPSGLVNGKRVERFHFAQAGNFSGGRAAEDESTEEAEAG